MRPGFRFSLGRWLDIAFYGALGALLFVYIQPNLLRAVQVIDAFIPNRDLQMVMLFAAACVALWKMNQWLGIRIRHFKCLLRFPPLPTVVPIAMLCAAFLPTTGEGGNILVDTSKFALIGSVTVYAIITGIQLFILRWRSQMGFDATRRRMDQLGASKNSLDAKSDSELITWVKREEPIRSTQEDLFGFEERANRLVAHLLDDEGDTVAIIGRFGCGKSSLVALVETAANKGIGPALWFCKVSCWGFDDSSAVQELILEHSVARLAQEMDCFRIRRLPPRYVKAMAKTSGVLDALSQILGEPMEPLKTLQEFTPLLQVVGARLIVVIEDGDRNGMKYDITHVQALLHRFRDVQGLSFIICVGPAAQVDFTRLCEHIESIPDLPEAQVLTVVDRAHSDEVGHLFQSKPDTIPGYSDSCRSEATLCSHV